MRKLLLPFLLLVLSFGTVLAAPVNINTADAVTLAASIKGVGAKRAEAIVAYRKEHGPFASVDELKNVRGIGNAVVETNRKNLTVSK